MIINHRYKFIFIKTRKTAGTSIEIALSKFCSPDDIITPIAGKDERIRQEKGFGSPQNYDIPFRNQTPIDWLHLITKSKTCEFKNHSDARFIRRHVSREIWDTYYKFCFERNPFDKAISRYYWSTDPPRPDISVYLETASRRRLSNWSIYTINNEIAVDFIGRYERLDDDLEAVSNKLELPEKLSLPRAKGAHRLNRDHYSRVLDDKARARIELVCANEIKAFDYHWAEEPQC